MCKKFYLADWHYGHANCLGFDNRPFVNIHEANNELVNRWNSVVSDGDLVYVLGDMFWVKSSEAIPILDALNGQKFLVKGNHDRCSDAQFAKRFVKIDEYTEVDDNGRNVVLCHYPIPCFKNHFYGWYHLYGHVHSSFEYNMMENSRYQMEALYVKQCNMYNVGVMMPWMDYTPRTLDEIVDGYNRFKKWNSNNETN
jgi:calcineurin-like phosphoesterase family protein